MTGSRTVFDDDETVGSPAHKHYTDTSFIDFDGVGHYRTKTISGDLFGSPRTSTTAYNTIDSLVNPDALATGCYESCSTGSSPFVPPPNTAKWVLSLYPTTTTSETGAPGSPAVQETCFDKTTGFLSGIRTRADASRASKDVIAIFGKDANGAVNSEKYYGGDIHLLTSSANQALCATVDGTPGDLGYDIRHTYDHAVRVTSEYYSSGTTAGFKFLDLTVDPNTGLTLHSRDTAQVDTEYKYYPSLRLKSVQTGTDPQINYIYTNATSSAGANVTIDQTSAASGTPQASFDYDGLGRLVLQSRTLPRSTLGGATRWTRQKTVYDAMGRKTKVSEWEESSSPSHFTISSGFDMFGRPGTITRPDGKTTTFGYQGVRQIARTAYIHTASGNDTGATTTETYDLHGRLHQVNEPGNNTISTYSYDVGGRLQGVSMIGDGTTQTRSFTYDNRGFLGEEVHPEIGTSGNGTTSYKYDARGHAHIKTTGTANGTFDLRFAYDASERLTDVYDNGSSLRQLKHFDFATANAGTNKQQGKLTQAVRTNHLAAGDITVTENYQYTGTSGRASSRETIVKNGDTTLEDYTQDLEYDDLGAVTKPGYPVCKPAALCNDLTALTGATYLYRDGSLIAVPNYATLSYSGNMLSQIDHQGGVSDLYRQDTSNGMSRPSSIAFQNVNTCSAPSAPVIAASSPVCAGSAGNTASVTASGNVQWSITGGTITAGATTNTVTYTAGGTGTLTLSAVATNSCGTSPAGTRNVTVAAGPTATLTITGSTTITRGSSTTLHVVLTGTSQWTLTWSNLSQQTVSGSFDLPVSPQTTTTYQITAVSDGSAAPCNTGPASASVTVTVQMPAPASLTTTLLSDHVVRVTWAAVSGTGVTYRLERSPCLWGCGWPTIVNSISTNSYDYTAPATTLPEAWLYHVIATASGTTESVASPFDYATTANVLFAENLVSGSTVIKGTHVSEIRLAIDKLRAAANLPAYMTPTYSNGWSNYNAQTGFVYASYVLAMRTALSEAAAALGHPVTFSGETPAVGSNIYAYQYTQLRAGVK
jgi:hypothetical protein